MSLSVYHHHCRFHAGRVIAESVNRRTGVCLSVCQSRGCRGYNSTLRRRYLPIYRVYCGGKTQPAAMQILKRDSLAVNAASVRFGLLYEGCARRGCRKPWFSLQNIKKVATVLLPPLSSRGVWLWLLVHFVNPVITRRRAHL